MSPKPISMVFLLDLCDCLNSDAYPFHLHVCDVFETPNWLLGVVSAKLQEHITQQRFISKDSGVGTDRLRKSSSLQRGSYKKRRSSHRNYVSSR